MSESFFFDEFFVPDSDPGVTYQIPVKGRLVPIVCKRGLTLKDKEEASQSAIARHVDENGKLVIDGIDDLKLTLEVLARTIKSWPFVFRDTGQPVPITPEHIAAFISEGSDRLMQAIAKGRSLQEEEADGPFGASSDAPSSTPEDTTSESSPAASPSA